MTSYSVHIKDHDDHFATRLIATEVLPSNISAMSMCTSPVTIHQVSDTSIGEPWTMHRTKVMRLHANSSLLLIHSTGDSGIGSSSGNRSKEPRPRDTDRQRVRSDGARVVVARVGHTRGRGGYAPPPPTHPLQCLVVNKPVVLHACAHAPCVDTHRHRGVVFEPPPFSHVCPYNTCVHACMHAGFDVRCEGGT